MTRRAFTASEIAAAAREARAQGVVIELHKPDGSRVVMRPMDGQHESAHGGILTGGNSCDKAFGP